MAFFFEDINYASDGGLYAELVENRSFEHREATYAWTKEKRGGAEGIRTISNEVPIHPNNPHFLRLQITTAGEGYGVSNLGYGGIPVAAGGEYHFAVHARAADGYKGGLVVRLESKSGKVLTSGKIAGLGTFWEHHKLALASLDTEAAARLVVLADAPGTVDIDMVSLFPKIHGNSAKTACEPISCNSSSI